MDDPMVIEPRPGSAASMGSAYSGAAAAVAAGAHGDIGRTRSTRSASNVEHSESRPASEILRPPSSGGGGGLPALDAAKGSASPRGAPRPQPPRRRLASQRAPMQRSPRAAVVAEQPQLKNASTQALLMAMELGRRKAEEQGDYLEAQDCLERMRALTLFEGQLASTKIKQKGTASEAAQRIAEENRQRLFEFTKLWEQSMREFEAKSEQLLRETHERHQQRFEEEEELLRSELAQKKPHFSRHVIGLREMLQRKVQLQDYREAASLQREVSELEAEERRSFEENLSLRFASKTKQMKAKFDAETAALKQRIASGRNELLAQRRLDYANVVQRQANAVAEAEQRTRTDAAKEQKALQRQLSALLSNSSKIRGMSCDHAALTFYDVVNNKHEE